MPRVSKRDLSKEYIYKKARRNTALSYFYRAIYYISLLRVLPNYLASEMYDCYIPNRTVFQTSEKENNSENLMKRELSELKRDGILKQANINQDELKSYKFTRSGAIAIPMLFPELEQHHQLMKNLTIREPKRVGKIMETLLFLIKSGIDIDLTKDATKPILTKYPNKFEKRAYPFEDTNSYFFHSHEVKRDEDTPLLDKEGSVRYANRTDIKGNALTGTIISNGGIYLTYSGYDGKVEILKNQAEAKSKGVVLQLCNASLEAVSPFKPEDISAILIVKDYDILEKVLKNLDTTQTNNRYAMRTNEVLSFLNLYEHLHILTYSGKGYLQLLWLTQPSWRYRLNVMLFGKENVMQYDPIVEAVFQEESRRCIQFIDNDIKKLNRFLQLSSLSQSDSFYHEIWCLSEQVDFLLSYCKEYSVELKIIQDETFNELVLNTQDGMKLW